MFKQKAVYFFINKNQYAIETLI